MRGCIIVLFMAVSVSGLLAQTPMLNGKPNTTVFDHVTSRDIGEGEIHIIQNEGLKQLVLTHVQMNERSSGVEGFRVQLYSGSGSHAKQEALEVKSKVLASLPSSQIYVEYNAPFWRVRVGSFRHKHEALPLLHQLKSDFPNCYVVRELDLQLQSLP